MNIYEKLNKARSLFHSRELKKSGLNKFAGYSYFELADFVVPALEVFSEVGLCAFITFQEEAVMRIVNVEDASEMLILSSPMSEASLKGCHPVQNLGAVQTYLRRYLWMLALEIVEHDAVDASEDPPPKDAFSGKEAFTLTRERKDKILHSISEGWEINDIISKIEESYTLTDARRKKVLALAK